MTALMFFRLSGIILIFGIWTTLAEAGEFWKKKRPEDWMARQALRILQKIAMGERAKAFPGLRWPRPEGERNLARREYLGKGPDQGRPGPRGSGERGYL